MYRISYQKKELWKFSLPSFLAAGYLCTLMKTWFFIFIFLWPAVLHAQNINELLQSGNKKMQEGNTLGAIKDYTEAINLAPANAYAYLGRGSVYAELNTFDEAIADLSKAIALNADLKEAYFNRAYAYQGTGNYEKAIADVSKFLELLPGDAEALLKRAELYELTNRQENMRSDLKKFTSIKAESFEDYITHGLVNLKLNDTVAALNDLTMAIVIEPEKTETFKMRGDIYFSQGQYSKAIEDYNVFLIDHSNDQSAILKRGESYARLEIYSGAIEDYTRLLQTKPKADWYFDRGFFNMQIKKYADAKSDFDAALGLKVADASLAFNNRGICSYFLGNKTEACADWKAAGEVAAEFYAKYCTGN